MVALARAYGTAVAEALGFGTQGSIDGNPN